MAESMDWDRVRVFHAVAHAGSFTRAAERLGLSQSAISRQIRARGPRHLAVPSPRTGLVLTEQGEYCCTRPMRSPSGWPRCRQRSATASSAAGHLRVNTTIGIGTVWLVGQLADFVERHPDIASR